MAELSKDIVGRKMEPFTFTVERGKVKEFLQAIGETNAIYHDVSAAKAAGYTDTPVPLTFQTAFTFWGMATNSGVILILSASIPSVCST
jgi:hypothetical protein